MSKKLGFALGAGGSRGVAHIGFLKAMEEHGIKPDFISGCSMGAVVGCCYASGMTPDEMYKQATKLKLFDIFDLSLNAFRNGALLRSKKMLKRLNFYLKDYTFDTLKIPTCVVATDLISGQTITLGGDRKVADCVAASSSIPSVFKPFKIDEYLFADGGIKCRVPVSQVRDMGADIVVAVDVLGNVRRSEKKYNIVSVVTRMIDISDAELNTFKMEKENPDLIITPDLGDMSQYKFKDIQNAFKIGYEAGNSCADKILQLLS